MLPGWGCAGWSLIHRQTLNDALRYPGEAVVGYNPKTYKHTHTQIFDHFQAAACQRQTKSSVFFHSMQWQTAEEEEERDEEKKMLEV